MLSSDRSIEDPLTSLENSESVDSSIYQVIEATGVMTGLEHVQKRTRTAVFTSQIVRQRKYLVKW